MESSPQGSL